MLNQVSLAQKAIQQVGKFEKEWEKIQLVAMQLESVVQGLERENDRQKKEEAEFEERVIKEALAYLENFSP